eukprot:735916-Hanusia_phi.AAC.2
MERRAGLLLSGSRRRLTRSGSHMAAGRRNLKALEFLCAKLSSLLAATIRRRGPENLRHCVRAWRTNLPWSSYGKSNPARDPCCRSASQASVEDTRPVPEPGGVVRS